MTATETLTELKKMHKSLAILFSIFIIANTLLIAFITYQFVHYLSLYDFTTVVEQSTDNTSNSKIDQRVEK